MKNENILNIYLKKGNHKKLKGKLIAYAKVDENIELDSNMAGMIKNGIMAVQANYVDQKNIRDFFEAEFGISLEKGIQEIIEQAKESGGLEGALDPEMVRDKLESMKNMEFIPIPAKISFFESEEMIMEEEADIYYLGHFKAMSHAHLSVNAFPILYQAKFREQEHSAISEEIATMLHSLEDKGEELNQVSDEESNTDIKDELFNKILPNMIYNLTNQKEYSEAEKKFLGFMKNFGSDEDSKEMIELVKSDLKDTTKLKKLELMVDKIEALQSENYEALEDIKNKMKNLG